MYRPAAPRIVKCEICNSEFNLDKEEYASMHVIDKQSGSIKRRGYSHLVCHNQKLLEEEYSKYFKLQSENI